MTPEQYIEYGLIALGMVGAIAAAFGLGPKLARWLDAKAAELSDFTGLRFIDHLDEVLVAYATDLYHSEIKALKTADRWDDGAKSLMMATLIRVTKEHFGLARLATTVANAGDVDSMLRARGEVAILEAKRMGREIKKI